MARSTMTALLEELRGLTEAGTADYTAGTTSYWSDDILQDVMDLYRTEIVFAPLGPVPDYTTGGTLLYYNYHSGYKYFETTSGGTSVFYLQDAGGTTLGTALYSVDYRRGIVTFSSDTYGSAIYVTGRIYDVNAAAADVWRKKAAHVAPTSFDFSADNHSIKRSQVYQHCLQMAEYFEAKSSDAIQVVSLFRGDVD